MSDGAVIPDDLSRQLAEIASDEPRSHTDDGNAYRLIDLNADDLRYLHGLGWLVWDGTRWAVDAAGEMTRRARDIVRRLYDQAHAARATYLEENPSATETDAKKNPIVRALMSHAKSSGSARGVHSMIDLAASDARIVIGDASDLDADPWLLNAPNGTVDLRTGELRAHDRSDLCTRCTSTPYDPDATAPTWLEFINRVTGGDTELVAYIQRLAGYALTGHTTEQVLTLLIGHGLNGKSTFLEAFRGVLGDYAADTPAETLLGDSRGGPQPELVRLRGARLVTASETSAKSRMNETLVKRLTGGDTIAARNLYSNKVVEYRPSFKIWLVSNNKPGISEQSLAMWRRLRLVPFQVTIPPTERDPDLARKLHVEAPGILAWAVRGARAWSDQGLGDPKAVRDATDEYRMEEDTLGAFIAERCDVGTRALRAGRRPVRGLESLVQEARGEKPGTATHFGKALSRAEFKAERRRGDRVRMGLQLVGGSGRVDGLNPSFQEVSTHARAGAHALGNFPKVPPSTRQPVTIRRTRRRSIALSRWPSNMRTSRTGVSGRDASPPRLRDLESASLDAGPAKHVDDVLAEYADYLPMTVRQIFYRLVGRHGYPKDELAYGRLCEHLNRARRARLIPFWKIRDDGVIITHREWYDGIDAFWDDTGRRIKSYRRDRQNGQAQRLELWCEASGMMPQLARVADRFSVPVYSASGFTSVTGTHDIAVRAIERNVPTVICTSATTIPAASRSSRAWSRTQPRSSRPSASSRTSSCAATVALTPEQVAQYDLPTAPPKRTDSRAGGMARDLPGRSAATRPARATRRSVARTRTRRRAMAA